MLIAGPTASGKSALALELAERLKSEGRKGVIVNADSAQVYADLQVLSARPSAEEIAQAEHRLYGAWDGSQACSAAQWAEAAKREIADIHAHGDVPILVGGTGLYIRTLMEGIAPVPAIPADVRDAVRALPTPDAFAELATADPASSIVWLGILRTSVTSSGTSITFTPGLVAPRASCTALSSSSVKE